MREVLFATSNSLKVRVAREVAREYGFGVRQTVVEVDEIQDEDGEKIARDKAHKIFAQLQKPVVISDDHWFVAGLNGFPGPYMKSVNEWFSVDDWLRLTRDLQDRRVTLRQLVIYQDEHQQKLFSKDLEGVLLQEARGVAPAKPMALISFDGGKTSVAERQARGIFSKRNNDTAWHDLYAWLSERSS